MRQLKIQKSITNRSSEALDKYLVEIGRVPMISVDEEIELAQKIVAKQYQHQGLGLTDLIDEGNIGLVKAAEKFDETRGFKFISYAVWWIRQSILQAIAEQSRIVRLPLNQVGALSKINSEISKFEQKNQRRPSVQELSSLTNIDETKIDQTIKADNHHSRADKQVDYESMAKELDTVLRNVLKDREITIVRECFGIGCHEKGLEEIGDQLGLTRERVRQIREKSIVKLRESGYAKLLIKYLG